MEIIPDLVSEMKYNTVVWIPSISILYSSDVLFNQVHPFSREITQEERPQWIRDVESLPDSSQRSVPLARTFVSSLS